MECDKCGEKAAYFRRYSGQIFCSKHFMKYFEDKIRSTLRKYRMLERGERVGVALSGGKDSMSTLFILKELEEKLDIDVCAIAVDEGIDGYRKKTLTAAERFCSEYSIPLYGMSFSESFGTTLDEIAGARNACTYCGVLRRRLLNEKARELKLDKLATGHNLDDEVQAILMNYIRGDIERLIRLERSIEHKKFVKRIKPLLEMPEKEVALYAILKDLNVSFDECPYARDSFRGSIRDFISTLEKDNAGIKFSILKGYQKLLPYLEDFARVKVRECEICNEPSSQKICKVCQLIKGI
jgi:uncharacterized protein (TIGR00269 family)